MIASVIARGLLRETARLLQEGIELDAAIRQATAGATCDVKDLYTALMVEEARAAGIRQTSQDAIREIVMRFAAKNVEIAAIL